MLIVHFHGKLKRKLEVSDSTLPPTPPEDPLSPQCLVTHHFSLESSYPLHTLDNHRHGFSRATQDSWNVTQRAVLGQLFTVEKISLWYSAQLAASAGEGGKFARDLVACGPLAPTCSHSSQRRAAACSQSTPSPAQELRSDCTPRCFSVKSCPEKPHRRPQHKQDIHAWKTAATKKPEWNQSESC